MRYAFFLLLLFNFSAQAQALRDINYKYLYNPTEPYRLEVKTVLTSGSWTALYNLHFFDSTASDQKYFLQWELRNSLSDKEGKIIQTDSIFKRLEGQNTVAGKISIDGSTETQILVTKVISHTLKRAWMFYNFLEANYPVNGYLVQKENAVLTPYVKNNSTVALQVSEPSRVVSYYNDDFPAATPAFSESQARVSKGMAIDSTFTVPANQEMLFAKKGLYLVQNDTAAAQGFAFRVEDDYPRLAKIESLADPMIYICTRQEFDRIKQAKGEKKAFDRVILSITGDAGRAKTFMRSYFKRVEYANLYFTSYKEGWKTDRGMIYIIFGPPDEVFRFANREVWNYKSASYKINFEFVKSASIFDPDNYVLIREKRFQQTWYEVIDLWRNARF